MEMDPKVSIIIPVYNGSNYLQEAIDSALAQTYKNIEIIVVNDGSNDGGKTEKIALSYGESIRYFYKPNGGVATALNLGIEQMKGEYFSWLSHDDLYLPPKIEQEVACLKEQDDQTTIIAEGYQIVDVKGNYIATVNLQEQYSKVKLKNPLFLLLRGGINGCALLIHKSHFKRIGVFNIELPTTQDYDLWFRMFRGEKVVYMQTAHVLSRSHAEQGGKAHFETHMKECDQLWIRMMGELSSKEKISLGGSEFAFYRDLWFFLETTNYIDAIRYARFKMLDGALKEYYKTGVKKDLLLACTLLGIKKSLLFNEPFVFNLTFFCPEKYEHLQQPMLWYMAGPIRLIERISFFLREGNFNFFLQKFMRIWKRDGTVAMLKKLRRKIRNIKKGYL